MLYWKKGVRMNGGDNLTPEIKELKMNFLKISDYVQ